MNKTTEVFESKNSNYSSTSVERVLTLAEEALEELHYSSGTVKAVTLYKSALAAIREVLAKSKPAPDDRIPKTVFTLDDISKAAEMGRQAGMIDALAEPVKQEPVALQDIKQYRMQMAGISAAALGYWKEGGNIHPDYDTPALRDVVALYAKYAESVEVISEAHNKQFQSYVDQVKVDREMSVLQERLEALAEQDKQEPLMDYERINALREGEQNGAEDAYFFVRPENDTPSLRKMFCQGFERGFHKGLKYASHVRTKDLTDDEIMKINVDTASIVPTCDRQFHFARAVIAADREKNK